MSKRIRTKEYVAWINMKDRCYNKKHKRYRDYGARGITVCGRWLQSFQNFIEDMGCAPAKNLSLDRFPDKNGNYEPNNCRWATHSEQMNNRRIRVAATYNGITKSLTKWSQEFGVTPVTIARRIKNGYDIGIRRRKKKKKTQKRHNQTKDS